MNFDCCHLLSQKNKDIKQIASLFKVVSETNRLRILCLLQEGGLCVCEIFEKLVLPQNLTSHHLSVLKKAGLVNDEKRGQRTYYSLTLKGRKTTRTILKLVSKGGGV